MFMSVYDGGGPSGHYGRTCVLHINRSIFPKTLLVLWCWHCKSDAQCAVGASNEACHVPAL